MPVFLEAKIVDNIFQLSVLKTMWQIKKSYDGMFQAVRDFTFHKIFKSRILSQTFLQNETFFLSSLKCVDLIVLQE